MIDLANLKLVEEDITVADDAQYVDASSFPPAIPEGIYTFTQGKPAFKATGKGFLQAEMTHTVAGGEQDGKTVSFDRISDKPFERSGVRVNMMKDQLRAIGDHATYRTHQEYATALEAAEGKPFKAEVQWEGGCAHVGTPQECEWTDPKVFRVKWAKNFMQNGSGKPSDSIPCPTCGQEVAARAKINRRIAQ
jgi:hypothetical protein